MPKVTVIIPVYNAEDTIERCLDSVLNQTLKDLEVIAINDKSTDKSLDIFNKYREKYKNLIVLNNEENLGPAGSRNKGLDLAKGEYIGFVDSDDYIEKNMYEVMSSYMNDEIDLVTCSRTRDTGQKIKEIINRQETTNPKDLSLISNYTADKLLKKSILDKYNIRFPEKYRYAEDMYLLTVYRCYCNKMKIIQDVLYHITFNPNSITNSYNKNIIMILEVLKDLKKFLEDNNFYPELEDEFLKICCQYYSRRVYEFRYFSNFWLKEEYVRKFLKFLKKNFKNKNYDEYIKKYWKKEKKPEILTNYLKMLRYIKRQEKRIKKK